MKLCRTVSLPVVSHRTLVGSNMPWCELYMQGVLLRVWANILGVKVELLLTASFSPQTPPRYSD
jgi:hypothetical protein